MSNLNADRINVILAAADVTAINTAISTINTKVPLGSNGLPATLTDDERSRLSSMRVDNKQFTDDVLTEVALNGATVLAGYLAGPGLQNDVTCYEQADAIVSALKNSLQRWEDVARLCAHEAYTKALAVYGGYKNAADDGVPGAQESYDRLKVRYDSAGNTAASASNPQ